jgi:methyl-accepting chemotaxis protein
MGQIEDTSRQISDVISVIDSIADQTNLLALNAAIEAARAGEHGRGFAVVAGEVDQLSKRCAAAARQVRELITTSVEAVHSGVKSVRDSGRTLDEIEEAVTAASESIAEIAESSGEQAERVADVEHVIRQLEEMTNRNAALVEQVHGASESMSGEAALLNELVAIFKLDGAESDSASRDARRTARVSRAWDE